MGDVEIALSRLARAKAIEDAIIYVDYLNKNFNLNLRKSPKDIISIAREFTKFIEEDCDCEHYKLDKEIIKCAVCKAKFNVLKADWCKHNPRHTKLCPNGHCICDRLDSGIWKEANKKEKLYGIERVYIGKG